MIFVVSFYFYSVLNCDSHFLYMRRASAVTCGRGFERLGDAMWISEYFQFFCGYSLMVLSHVQCWCWTNLDIYSVLNLVELRHEFQPNDEVWDGLPSEYIWVYSKLPVTQTPGDWEKVIIRQYSHNEVRLSTDLSVPVTMFKMRYFKT